MQFLPYAIPAILALVAKAGMFFYARYSRVQNTQTRLYLLFLFSLSIQNLAELTFFIARSNGLSSPPGGTIYFAASIFALAFLLHLAIVMGTDVQRRSISTTVLALLYGPVLVLQALLWGGLLVAGFEPMGYTYTKVPGPAYFLFELFALGCLGTSVAFCVNGALRHSVPFHRIQNRLLLVGLLPLVALAILIIVLQRFGLTAFNTTATLPLAVTFFLAVTAYATHQIRLFDIEFFIPWSKVRKRKTAFYKRIQALIAEIADMSSVNKIVQGLADTLRCPVVLIGGPRPALAMAGEAFGIARFPVEELKKINSIVVANEIASAMPRTYSLMKRHKVAAIVPFHPHSEAAASWMLLGESFSEHVYTPLDFKVVETLFARLADHFLDKQLLLRSQLSEAQREMQLLQERLATAWDQLESARKNQKVLEEENHLLRRKNVELLREGVEQELLSQPSADTRTPEEYRAEFEARMIEKALKHCGGDRERAAEILGLSEHALHHKIVRYGLDRTRN